AALAQASAACNSVATLNDSRMPSAPVGSIGVVRPNAAMTSGCTLGMTNLSMRQPLAASAPADTADSTPAVSPPMSTMYLPEQIERDRISRTLPALSIVSATRNPAATLDSSINPMDLSAINQKIGRAELALGRRAAAPPYRCCHYRSNIICCSVTSATFPANGACRKAPIAFGAGSPMIWPADTRSPAFTFGRQAVPALCLSGNTSRVGSILPEYSGAGRSYCSTCSLRVRVLMGTCRPSRIPCGLMVIEPVHFNCCRRISALESSQASLGYSSSGQA